MAATKELVQKILGQENKFKLGSMFPEGNLFLEHHENAFIPTDLFSFNLIYYNQASVYFV